MAAAGREAALLVVAPWVEAQMAASKAVVDMEAAGKAEAEKEAAEKAVAETEAGAPVAAALVAARTAAGKAAGRAMVAAKVAKAARARAATVGVVVARAAVETAVGGEATGAGPAATAARRVGWSRYADRLGQGRLPDSWSQGGPERSRRQHHRSGPLVPRSE